jgi:ABC-2 type transport system permease protein
LLAIFTSYFAFAVPGMVAIAVVGGLIYGLPLTPSVDLVWAVPTLLLGGVALAGIGALIGLAGRDEQLAGTYANLAMMAVLFLAIVPTSDFPGGVRALLGLLPSTYMVDCLKLTLVGTVHLAALTVDLIACALFAAIAMAASTRVLHARSE